MSVNTPIYLDNHATTPCDPRVAEAMWPYLTQSFGNAASRNHSFGWTAREAVEIAREQIAELLGGDAKEIVFTSGATESDNLAIKGVAKFYESKGKHIITATTEHKAILDSCHALEAEGWEVTYLGVGEDGRISLDELEAAFREDTVLVSIMLANNEIGVIQPIAEIGEKCRARKIIFHCDAVQGLGRIPFDVSEMNVDLVSISAHKMYGPKGIGALWVRRGRPNQIPSRITKVQKQEVARIGTFQQQDGTHDQGQGSQPAIARAALARFRSRLRQVMHDLH